MLLKHVKLIFIFLTLITFLLIISNVDVYSKKKTIKNNKNSSKVIPKTNNKKTSKSNNNKKKIEKKDTKKKSTDQNKQQDIKSKGKISNHQDELEKLTKSIQEDRQQINKLTKQEKTTQSVLSIYKQNTTRVQKYIGFLNKQINVLQDTISNLESFYDKLKERLALTQTKYTNFAKKLYLQPKPILMQRIINPAPAENELRMKIYSQRITDILNEYAQEISQLKDSILLKTSELKQKTEEQLKVKQVKENEKKVLTKTITEKNQILNEIRKDKQSLIKQLALKEQSAKKIKSLIASLVQKELKKSKEKPKITPKSTTGKIAESNKPSESGKTTEIQKENKVFEAPSSPTGVFNWPIPSHSILRGFGPSKNPTTNTVIDNLGIDIQTKVGTSVKSVAAGNVSVVSWLPGYQNLIIINHGNGMRTVYANLSSVSVSKDENIPAGKVIGKTGSSVDGDYLHFEIYKGSKRLNPLGYIK